VTPLAESIALHVQLACIWEATACKPGNVHRHCDFEDLSYLDFLASAATIAPVLAEAPSRRVGETVLEAMRRTRAVVSSNTNLGILLLLAPLAKACDHPDLRAGVEEVLIGLDTQDARQVYEAIRLVQPGGLGDAAEQDVRDEPTRTLRDVMNLAADRDLIARQYANGFCEVFDDGAVAIAAGLRQTGSLEEAIILSHLRLMARHPDTLIERKCGTAVAQESAARAQGVLEASWPETETGQTALEAFDTWLRAEGHRRNPGTTADLVAASLFVLLRQGGIPLPQPAGRW
jgi:triphosphoribosyl-dephospho-CoA synthase